MATRSIHTVDVDDAAFQRFNTLFQKYQAQVKSMPGAWKATGNAVNSVAAHFADMTAAMMSQRQILHDQLTEQRAIERTERAALNVERSRAREMKAMAGHAKNIAGNLAKGTMSLLKWAGIGGILSGLAGAGGLWGLDRIAAGVGDARRSAQGLGVTSGQQQAYGLNFGRYVDANSNLANIADAKSDYGKRGYFSMMGVNPNGKDPATLGAEMMVKAKKIFDQGDQSEQYAQAHGLLQFYTMDELRRLHATSMADLRASGNGYGRDAKGLALSDGMQKKWQDFGIQMDRATLQIKNTFVDSMTPLIPVLLDLSKAFVKTAADFLSNPHLKEWITDFATGVKKFADFLGSDKFQTDMRNFIDRVAQVTEGLYKLMVKLHIIDPGPADWSKNPQRTPQQEDAELARSKQSVQGVISKAKGEVWMAQKFERMGWKPPWAAGMAANLWQESGNNPFRWGDNGTAYGLAQWHADRRKEYTKLFGHTMESVTNFDQAIKEQTQFINWEMTKGHNAEQRAWNGLTRTNEAGDSAAVISEFYERPAATQLEKKNRAADARTVITIMNQTGAHVSVQGSQLPQ